MEVHLIIFNNSNGDVYIGEWLNDKMHGKGIFQSEEENFSRDVVF